MSAVDYPDGFAVAAFDPPSSRNLGWAVLQVADGVAKMAESGVHPLPEGDADRLMSIQSFVVDLFDRWDIRVMCFERAIGRGQVDVRERIGENTGVIKLVGASYGCQLAGIHASTSAKVWTGHGGARDRDGIAIKTRTKRMSRDMFFPGQTFKSISVDDEDKENFEHQADAIGLAACWLLKHGVPVTGHGMSVLPLKVEEDEQG